jgi:hypothetical protein
VVPLMVAQFAFVTQPRKHVFVPALFLMHQVLPGQSIDDVQGLVHQRPLQVPLLGADPQVPVPLQGLPIPPLAPPPPVPPVPAVPPAPQNSGNAQALLPLSSSTQQLLLHSESMVQLEEQKAPRGGKFTHRA